MTDLTMSTCPFATEVTLDAGTSITQLIKVLARSSPVAARVVFVTLRAGHQVCTKCIESKCLSLPQPIERTAPIRTSGTTVDV